MKTTSTWWKILLSGLLLAGTLVAYADAYQPSYSTAGFYQLSNTGRTAYSMNPAWRFYKGHIEGAEQPEFNDKDWNIVSLPDGIEYLPTEASGCINYQGEIWYRKHSFHIAASRHPDHFCERLRDCSGDKADFVLVDFAGRGYNTFVK